MGCGNQSCRTQTPVKGATFMAWRRRIARLYVIGVGWALRETGTRLLLSVVLRRRRCRRRFFINSMCSCVPQFVDTSNDCGEIVNTGLFPTLHYIVEKDSFHQETKRVDGPPTSTQRATSSLDSGQCMSEPKVDTTS